MNLASIDLNLLVALDALLAERSVTRAAQRIGLSQPAASRALGRLRALLGDRLLVRAGGGLVPTPRAAALREPLGRALADVRGLLAPPSFDPTTAQGTIRLWALDLESATVVPSLLARIERLSPGLDIDIRPRLGDPFAALQEGTVDLAVGVFLEAPAGFRRQKLYDDDFVCLVRRGHPIAKAGLTVERYVEQRHAMVVISGSGRGPVDEMLARRGLARRIALRLPHFLAAPMIVAESDLVITLPRRLGHRFAALSPVVLLEAPLPLPGFAVSQLWHERHQDDPRHSWLRREIAAAARTAAR
jgi:DNA-binding transcriptional LysR family regulator